MTASLANGLAFVIDVVLNMVQLMVIASVLISWVGADSRNQIVVMIHAITEPIYRPLRKLTSNIPGPLDWAPLIVILIIIFVQRSLVAYLKAYAREGGIGGF